MNEKRLYLHAVTHVGVAKLQDGMPVSGHTAWYGVAVVMANSMVW